jgi:hypothetical protein
MGDLAQREDGVATLNVAAEKVEEHVEQKESVDQRIEGGVLTPCTARHESSASDHGASRDSVMDGTAGWRACTRRKVGARAPDASVRVDGFVPKANLSGSMTTE